MKLEGILAAIIGRPFLLIIKWLQWPFLIAGIYFSNAAVYDPATKQTSSKFTIIPLIIGFILFCISIAIKYYEIVYRKYLDDETQRDSEQQLAATIERNNASFNEYLKELGQHKDH